MVAVFDTEGRIVSEEKFPTPRDVTEYILHLKSVIDRLTEGVDITCLSVALPGDFKDGVLVWAGNLDWRGIDMHALLSDHYDCPIIVENDANLAGLAETRALAETPGVSLYLTVSTGIGTGITIDGKLHPRLSRAEGGRILLIRNGNPTIWESFASGKAIQATYGKLASEIEDDETWQIISDNLAQGLLTLCPFLQPDVVIIGGGVGAHFERFAPTLQATLRDNLHDGYMPVLLKAVHPEEAVVYGCYYHALDEHVA